jgi:hypothetical protein
MLRAAWDMLGIETGRQRQEMHVQGILNPTLFWKKTTGSERSMGSAAELQTVQTSPTYHIQPFPFPPLLFRKL